MAAAAPSARLAAVVAWHACACQQTRLYPGRCRLTSMPSRVATSSSPSSRPCLTSVSPFCRIRSRHASGNQRKAQSRKNVRERSSTEEDNALVDSSKGAFAGIEPEVSGRSMEEDADIGPAAAINMKTSGSTSATENGDDSEPTRGPKMQSLKLALAEGAEKSPIVSVDDLMVMIKDAEKNILLLNQVHARAFEELEQAQSDKDMLQNQVNVLQTRLAEADAKLKLAAQTKAKNDVLEAELAIFRTTLAVKEGSNKLATDTEADYRKLKLQVLNLEAQLEAANNSALKFTSLRSQTESLGQEVHLLRGTVAELTKKNEIITELSASKLMLQEYIQELENKLSAALAQLLEFSSCDFIDKVPVTERKSEYPMDASQTEVGSQQAKVMSLQNSLQQMEKDRALLEQLEAENLKLRGQVQMLEQKLEESDSEIRLQLQLFQAEVEAFQTSLERVRTEYQGPVEEVPVGEMPWDFWSHLLLQIDAWILGKKIAIEEGRELRLMAWRREARIRDAYVAAENEADETVIANLLQLTKARQKPGLHIVHVAAEMAPVAKVGGLGDVVAGLGRALQAQGHLVEVILPKYDCMDYTRIKSLKVLEIDLLSYFDGQMFKNKVWHGIVEGLPVYFIEPLHPARFFWRGQFYGENDDFRRFTYFCRAALEFLLQAGKKPDIIHSHDWQTAAVAPIYWDIYVPQGLDSAKLAFTCHNFEYQGTESPSALTSCGLSVQQHFRQDRMQDNFIHDRVNLLKGGLVFSNIVTTVSPTYAEEVRGPEGGKGLHVTLANHSAKFCGILNGIDNEAWNPATDPLLEHQYDPHDLSGKLANKAVLRKRLGLAASGPDVEKPLVGCITRLVPQKGVHLIRHAIYRTLELGGQFILLGSSPIPQIQQEFEGIARSFDKHQDVRLVLKYDETLSHSIYAASDMFIIPSIFEPCGLTQMISMRYGAIPVVRKTGGLNDSVFDVDDESIETEKRNGFTFTAATEDGLNYALDRSIRYYLERSEWWRGLVRKIMRMDFSWGASAEQYVSLYAQSIDRARARAAGGG